MSSEFDLNALTEGTELRELHQEIRQEDINRYAEASGDFNPIHIDDDFARATPLGGTIAHGMLILAYVSRMMSANFGQDWITSGGLNVRFKSPARPGDTVIVTGQIRKIEREDGRTSLKCSLLCRNQKDETIISGDAVLSIED